ncbi:speckle-type POZ protein B-like [Argiope bruennichi]|uniref:speckle-type POZ protein B-like n=1 Tax=Argiope bruennichi TaxID=94029 RepID=UPI0024954162|nr:speckle-type POZ protein B-like [Argiope bruennichi]
MLTGDMKEKKNECIEIEDIAYDVLDKFVFFLYTDTFKDLEWEAVIGLYYAADKYQVERLKILCCSFFLKDIDVHNVCEILMLIDKHHDSDFRMRVEDFILKNDDEVFSSSTWKQFVDEQPFLPAKTMLLKYDKDKGKRTVPETYDEKLSIHPTVQDDLLALYKSKIITDIDIICKDTTFHVHKSVLCASSIIMREWFKKDMKCKPKDIFEIQDLEDDIVSRMLLFLYTDSLEDVQWDIAMKLYHAADVYQILRLKIRCSCFLIENLQISNASTILLLAHEHQDAKLKSVVEDFIFMHDEEIFGSDEWAHFSESNVRLANETMRSKYKKKDDL